MAAKLKSILRQIHWSSLLKAGIFAAAWSILPFWAFFLVALYLYFIPLFQVGKLGVPFVILLFLMYREPGGFWFALLFGAIYYMITVIKDLIVIDRQSAYELLAFILSFLVFRAYYIRFAQGITAGGVVSGFFIAAILALLLSSYLSSFREEVTLGEGTKRASVWLSFLLFMQVAIAGLFLPLDFLYQAVLAFLVSILIFDLIPEHLFGTISRQKSLATGSVVFALFVIVLASASWGI